MTIVKLKEAINIVDVASNYTELQGKGNNLKAKVNPLREGGDLYIYENTQKYYDFGTGVGGDAIDFIEIVENLNKREAISFLQEKYLNGVEVSSNYVPIPRAKQIEPIKDNEKLIKALTIKANRYLSNPLNPISTPNTKKSSIF